jgi:hypothetical protein
MRQRRWVERIIAAWAETILVAVCLATPVHAQNADTILRRLGSVGEQLVRGLEPHRNNDVVGRRQGEKSRVSARAAKNARTSAAVASTRIPGFEVFDNADLAGGDIATFGNTTVAMCAAACLQTAQCTGFTYNADKGVCFLKSVDTTPQRFVGAISGRKVATQQASRATPRLAAGFQIFKDADMPGGDLASYGNATADQCQAACAQSAQCMAFTHNIDKGVCFLKSVGGTLKYFAGAVSGLKVAMRQPSRAPLEPPAGFQIFNDTDMPGSDLASYRNATAEQCQEACAQSAQCVAFTHNIEKAVCFLKSSSGNPQQFAGAVSGRKTGQPQMQSGSAPVELPAFKGKTRSVRSFDLFDGTKIAGASITSGFGFDEERCIASCASNAACIAFTLDKTTGGTCEIYSTASKPKAFSGGISGVRNAPLIASTAIGEPDNGFLRYRDTDLLSSLGPNSTPFADASVDNCQMACLMSDECQGFTYDTSRSMCSLKNPDDNGATIGRSQVKGVVSGLKQSTSAVLAAREDYFKALPDVPEANLNWQEGDTKETFVSRIRTAAKPMGGSCDVEREKLRTLAASLKANFSDRTAIAGGKIKVDWSVDRQGGSLPPVWLMMSADGPVRFAAPGFYALMPGAIAPFGLSADAERARAVTTLFGYQDPHQGTVDILPLTAGVLNVSVRLAGYIRACEEEYSSEVTAAAITVSPSLTPTFQVRDPFSFDRPVKVLLSPAGDTRLEVFNGRFRLVDTESGAFLADREGLQPSYSPTGRFVLFTLGENGYRVLDAVDGTVIADLSNTGTVAWENEDSFLVAGESGLGGIFANSLLVKGAVAGDASDCRICSGRGKSYVLDLENDIVHGDADSAYGQRLSGRRDTSIVSDSKVFIAQQTNAAPVSFPIRWNLRGGLKFAPVEIQPFPQNGGELTESQQEERDHTVPVKEQATDGQVQTAALQATSIGQSRGVIVLERPKAAANALTARLVDLGLRFSPDVAPSFISVDPGADGREDKGEVNPSIAKKILASVPTARGAFDLTREPHNCNPQDELAPNGLERLFAIFDTAVEYKIGKRSIWLTFYGCVDGSAAVKYPNLHFFDSKYDKGFLRISEGDSGGNDQAVAAIDSGIFVEGGSIGTRNFESRLYANRYLLIWSKGSQAIMLFDIDTRKTIWKEFNLGRADLLKEAFYSVEDQHVTQLNTDGSFYVYDVPGKKRVLEGRYVDDETIAWTRDLRFDASPEGANYVNLRFAGQRGQYAFQQFSRTVKRPGLVAEVLARSYTPSDGTLSLPPRLSGLLDEKGNRIEGTVLASGASEVRVYQDGLLTDTIASPQTDDELPIDVARVSGARWVSLLAYDRQGLASLPIGRDLGRIGLPVVHALTVGIDKYEGEGLKPLRYANRDSGTLLTAIEAQDGKSLKLGTKTNLSDAAATPEAILAAVESMVATAGKGETIVFSYAGHGVTGPDGRFYIATTGTRAEDIAGSALAWDRVASVLSKAQARVIVFLDACHSGAAGTAMFATNDGAVDDVLQGVPSGLLVFSASKGRQVSEESPVVGGGFFTNAVADVISRDRAVYDLDHNGAIEASELYLGIKRKVSNETDGRQVPWFAHNELVGDFSVF